APRRPRFMPRPPKARHLGVESWRAGARGGAPAHDRIPDSVRDDRHPGPGMPSASLAPVAAPPALARGALDIAPNQPPWLVRTAHSTGRPWSQVPARAGDSAE